MSTPTSFNEWLKTKYGIEKWVLSRKTKRVLERYPDSTFFSQKEYDRLIEEHRVALREDTLVEIAGKHNFHNYVVLREAFEAGRSAPR